MDKTHVLLIDDDLDEFEFFLPAIEKMSAFFKCTYASSGYDGLKMPEEIKPDFIFIDMNMPRCNGLECIREIKKREDLQSVPLILYSTSIDDRPEKQARALGVTNCLQKPVSLGILSKVLQKMVYLHDDFMEG